MKNSISIEEIADKNGLQVINTTQGMNGYPKGLGKALVGFDNYSSAEELAREIGGRVVELKKKDGWQFWMNTGCMHKCYDLYTIFFEKFCLFRKEDEELFYECDVKPMLDDYNSLEELAAFVNQQMKIYQKLRDMEDEQILVNDYVMDRYVMEYSYDTWNHKIGVVIEDD